MSSKGLQDTRKLIFKLVIASLLLLIVMFIIRWEAFKLIILIYHPCLLFSIQNEVEATAREALSEVVGIVQLYGTVNVFEFCRGLENELNIPVR